jgi:ribosome maturation factor RimP
MYETGPVIDIQDRFEAPQYFDEQNPNPPDIWPDDEPEFLWEKDTETEEEINKNKWAPKDEDDDDDDDDEDMMKSEYAPLQATQETREEIAGYSDEEEADMEMAPVEVTDRDVIGLDTRAISTIARTILDGLEEVEDELNVLSRHEIILTSPGASDVLETQRQFDAYRGFDVIVETVDPWNSNRVLRGKLLERNSMDVIINQKGRMVTIPLNFVKCVRLPPAKREKGSPADAPF